MRSHHALLIAAVSGILAGCGSTLTAENSDAGGAPAPGTTADAADKHACKGLNACKGKGGCKVSANGCAAKNDCKGKGGCATAKHDCKTKNDCKGLGGCKANDKASCKGQNDCKGKGGCATPPKEQ